MPLLDVTELLTDPDLASTALICTRFTQTVSDGGIASNAATEIQFTGVVNSAGGKDLDRLAEADRNKQAISVITKFRLSAGRRGHPADLVRWKGNEYTVRTDDDYSHFGAGFIESICVLLPLQGR